MNAEPFGRCYPESAQSLFPRTRRMKLSGRKTTLNRLSILAAGPFYFLVATLAESTDQMRKQGGAGPEFLRAGLRYTRSALGWQCRQRSRLYQPPTLARCVAECIRSLRRVR